jgi:hypothetical protein
MSCRRRAREEGKLGQMAGSTNRYGSGHGMNQR